MEHRETKAIHEAGHAVAAYLVGLEIESATIIPSEDDGTGSGTWVEFDWESADATAKRVRSEKEAVVIYAGKVAVRLFDPAHPRWFEGRPSWSTDEFMLSSATIDALAPFSPFLDGEWKRISRQRREAWVEFHQAYQEFTLICTEELVKQNKRAVRLVADALLEEGTLSAARIGEIMENLRASEQARQLAAEKASVNKRRKTQHLAAEHVRRFKILALPDRERLIQESRPGWWKPDAKSLDGLICARVCDRYSNYPHLRDALNGLKGRAGINDLQHAFKVLAFCLIIERCGLDLRPTDVTVTEWREKRLTSEPVFSDETDLYVVKQQALAMFGLQESDLACSKEQEQEEAPGAKEPPQGGIHFELWT